MPTGKSYVELAIAPTAQVKRDLWKNSRWVGAVLLALAVFCLASTLVMTFLEPGWTFLHSAYFTVINVTTVGFGDAVPATPTGRLLSGVNGIAGLLFFGVLIATLTMALQPSSFQGRVGLRDAASTGEPDEEDGASESNHASVSRQVGTFIGSLGRLLEEIPSEGRGEELRNCRIHIHSRKGDAHIIIDVLR